MHVSFIVYSHLQIPNILHILIKFENSYILDKKGINNENKD